MIGKPKSRAIGAGLSIGKLMRNPAPTLTRRSLSEILSLACTEVTEGYRHQIIAGSQRHLVLDVTDKVEVTAGEVAVRFWAGSTELEAADITGAAQEPAFIDRCIVAADAQHAMQSEHMSAAAVRPLIDRKVLRIFDGEDREDIGAKALFNADFKLVAFGRPQEGIAVSLTKLTQRRTVNCRQRLRYNRPVLSPARC